MGSVIILGGGYSVKEGIEKGLWDKIKGQTIWACNNSFFTVPYKCDKLVWLDDTFFTSNKEKISPLSDLKVEFATKTNNFLYNGFPYIKQYELTKDKKGYLGREALIKEDKKLYIGELKLTGTFAISLAIALGYSTIYILGFDYGTPNKSLNTHYYIDNLTLKHRGYYNVTLYQDDKGKVKPNVSDYEIFNHTKDIKIYNVSLISNIQAFEKISYEQFFTLLNSQEIIL